MSRPYDLIAEKRDGREHSPDAICDLVRSVVDGNMPDYQIAAWLMAAYLRGLTKSEILALTLAMRDSGDVVRWEGVPGIKLDKHSSGGVGDKTTLVVVPLIAAAGVPMLKMSGRGLGFSGGTIDKLESIPGFRTDLTTEEALAQVKRIGAALIGQSPRLVPADKKLYALRDVTATIDSVPLIAASIMSKKLAGGADAVLLDVKVGQGAFMKTLDRARELANTMVEIGSKADVRTVVALTAMVEPLGYAVGNALEVADACATLTGSGRVDSRFRQLCLSLSARGLVLAGGARTDEEALPILDAVLKSGAAAAKFAEIIEAQGGDPKIVEQPERLPKANEVAHVLSDTVGYVTAIDAEAVGRLAMEMGAGRVKKEDSIDPSAGIVLLKKSGDSIVNGEPLCELHLNDADRSAAIAASLREAITIGEAQTKLGAIVYEFIMEA